MWTILGSPTSFSLTPVSQGTLPPPVNHVISGGPIPALSLVSLFMKGCDNLLSLRFSE